jgi:hypothetical protein
MKKLLIGILALSSISAFALEGCEVVARSGDSAYRAGATTTAKFSLEKCAKHLAQVVSEGGWDEGVAEHANKSGEFTHLKLERVSKEEFIRVRNGR